MGRGGKKRSENLPKVLRILMNDGRKRYTEIARELGISTAAALKYVKYLFNERVILRMAPVLNYGKLGFPNIFMVEAENVPESVKDDATIAVMRGIGHSFVVFAAKDTEDLRRYLKKHNIKGEVHVLTDFNLIYGLPS
ncbi:MAG: Lrp/AsnC family transcriptional regulator [Candidatus Bathyarchaeia archaeon]